MKKFFVLLLAAVLVSAVFCISAAAEFPADTRFEVFDLTPLDADKDWYQDGVVVALPNDSDKEISAASGDYQLRYVFILVYDKDGACVAVGNNLLSADDERASEFPQHDVKIPAKGFAIFFYYNANEGPSNLALYEYYEAVGGAMYTNETGRPSKNYAAALENNTVTVYFASADAPSTEVSSEEPVESSEEVSSEESPVTSSDAPVSSDEPSAATSSEAASGTSSETSTASSAPASSDANSSQAEEGSSSTGIIIGVIVALVAVAAVVAGVLVAKKKKS